MYVTFIFLIWSTTQSLKMLFKNLTLLGTFQNKNTIPNQNKPILRVA